MSTYSLRKFKWAFGFVVAASITGSYLILNEDSGTSEPEVNQPKTRPLVQVQPVTSKTIATEWQWQETPIAQTDTEETMFTQESVYQAMQNVRLNDEGELILDHEALLALNATLDDSRLQLNDQSLADLQGIIRESLPGNAGEDVAEIVASYYQYLDAEKMFNSVYTEDVTESEVANIEEYQEYYRELSALRELYLGDETAEQLFATTDANANYMFKMLQITQSEDLTDEEKEAQSQEVLNAHTEETINVDNWTARYNAFLAAKSNIVGAAISEQQKRAQLIELMNQHFNQEELASISHLQLDEL